MTKVIICDDHPIVRKGLKMILEESGTVEVVAEAGSVGELRQKLRGAECDVLLMDIEMPNKSGIEALGMLKKEWPRMPVLIISIYPEEQYAVRALRAGASGYLNKGSAPERLVEAVRVLALGRKFISPEVSLALAEHVATGDDDRSAHEKLSDREFQVLKLIAGGKKLSEIADALALSPKTVSVYRARILEKLGVANNVEIARYALQHGLSGGSE